MPEQGKRRSDLGPNVRTLAMERRVLVVYRVEADTVTILRTLYAGRDFDADDIPP